MDQEHGIHVDHKGNVWIGGGGGRRFARPEVHEGRQVPDADRQEGRAACARGGRHGRSTTPTASTWRTSAGPPKIVVDPKTNEAYVVGRLCQPPHRRARMPTPASSSGLGRLRQQAGRHAVFAERAVTGDQTATGHVPHAPPAQQFRNPVHCADAVERRLRLRLRPRSDRIQVFTKDGKFVKETLDRQEHARAPARCGTSPSRSDPQQKYSVPRRRREREDSRPAIATRSTS